MPVQLIVIRLLSSGKLYSESLIRDIWHHITYVEYSEQLAVYGFRINLNLMFKKYKKWPDTSYANIYISYKF